ncbi:MAG TPA: CorA family divalent cation transporter [Gaiellaceae bacterium]|nr:CorA family divalent cation transporter [Gaiellaceae bacterium]
MSAILFDREQVDRLDDLPESPEQLDGSKLLWVDIDERSAERAEEIGQAFQLDDVTRDQLASSSERAAFNDCGRYIHITTYSPCEDEEENLVALECVVGENWVITAHDRPVAVLQEFADRVSGSGDTGVLDGPGFLATLLEWVLGAYSGAFDRLEQRLDEFDVQAMRGNGTEWDIERLVAERRQVGVLRRALTAHRSALTALTHPELEALGDDRSGERFQSLLSRFEATVQEARDARESVVGSFDVLIARTGHRTNAIMKVLTLASVTLLPGTLIAGVMGMNFKVGLFAATWAFYVVIAVMGAVALLTVGVAKRRDWL